MTQPANYITRRVPHQVRMLGSLWQPGYNHCATTIALDSDVEPTRNAVEEWLVTHTGDFSSIEDFAVDTLDIDWAKGEDSELAFSDAMYGWDN